MRVYWWSPSRSARDLRWVAGLGLRSLAGMSRYGGRSAKNFGDELSAAAVQYAFGEPARWSKVEKCDLMAIGSILETRWNRGSDCMIWGTGLRSAAGASTNNINEKDVLAVRGPLTRDAVGLDRTTTLGDPGLIAARLFKRRRQTGANLVIPHFSEFAESESLKQFDNLVTMGFRVAPPNLPYAEICEAIASAQFVLTSSLHGLIVSHALGVPAVRYHTASVRETNFKYQDYWGSLNIPEQTINLENFISQPDLGFDCGFTVREATARQADKLVHDLLAAVEQFKS